MSVLVPAIAAVAGCSSSSSSPSVSEQPLADYGCPPGGVDESGLDCSQVDDGADAEVLLEPSPESTSDPAEVTLTLRNESSEQLEFNPASWQLWVEQNGDWDRIEQTATGDGYEELPAGDSRTWNATDVPDLIRQSEFDFEPGTYLAAISIRSRTPACFFRIVDE
ncbi:hypothetical protein GCM10028857_06300 [Salinarchaeum chitinilyticum]